MPAFVHAFTPATSSKPSRTAARIAPHGDVVARAHAGRRRRRSAGRRRPPRRRGRSSVEHVGRRCAAADGTARASRTASVADEHRAERPRRRRRGRPSASVPAAGSATTTSSPSACGIADAGDLDAEQLEPGGQVGAGERGAATGEAVGDDLGHRVAGGDQAVDPAARGRRPRRSRRRPAPTVAQRVVDDDAAALADGEPGVAAELVAGPDAGGEHDEVGVERRRRRRTRSPATRAVGVGAHLGGGGAGAHVEPERLDVAAQRPPAAVVELHRHQARRELDDRASRGRAAAARWPPRARAARRRRRRRVRQPGGPGPDRRRGRRGCGRRTTPAASVPGIGGTNGDEPVASTQCVVGDRAARSRWSPCGAPVSSATTGSPRTSSTPVRRRTGRRRRAPGRRPSAPSNSDDRCTRS